MRGDLVSAGDGDQMAKTRIQQRIGWRIVCGQTVTCGVRMGQDESAGMKSRTAKDGAEWDEIVAGSSSTSIYPLFISLSSVHVCTVSQSR